MATVLADLENGAAHTLVLGCARDGRSRLGPIVEGLVARGHQVEVISDLDARSPGLLATMQRHGASALYVLFESPSLSLDRLRTLETELRGRGIPADRLRIAPLHDTESPPVRPPHAIAFPSPMIDPSGSQPIVPPVATPPPLQRTTASPSRRKTSTRSRPVMIGAIGIAAALAVTATVAFAMRSDGSDREGDGDGEEVATVVAQPEKRAERLDAIEPVREATKPPAEVGEESPDGDDEDDAPEAPLEPAREPAPARDEAPPTEATESLSDADAVYRALSERRVRALDLLLIAPEPVVRWRKRTSIKKTSYEEATSYCAELDIEGVTGWRLATIGELNTLTAGRMLDRGKFWSVTKADTFGSSRVVWNSQTAKMGPAPTKWRGGRVLCVRSTVLPTNPAIEHVPSED